VAAGLAPGEFSKLTSTIALAPVNTGPTTGSEINRSPALPVELNGVSVSVGGAAAGLYFVGNSPQQIDFVVPIGLASGTAPVNVVVNNNGTVIRGLVQIVAAQPDIFTTTMGAGGRALVCNVTNGSSFPCLLEPFGVMSLDSTGTLVPTILELNLSGSRAVTEADLVTVTIGTTSISATSIKANPNMPGWEVIDFTLPASLAAAGDVPIVVSLSIGGSPFTSRDAGTAPHITISP
jgi:uncharacterized protein (TIGR03437 family)